MYIALLVCVYANYVVLRYFSTVDSIVNHRLLDDGDYAALAEFRAVLRTFLAFSEQRANEVGLSAQQHQALLAIRGAEDAKATVGYIAERLILKPHSASERVHRLEKLSLIERRAATNEARKSTRQNSRH